MTFARNIATFHHMIPHEITLYNFLSYGQEPQTISFEGYNLICLSGRNGHGKSALLDAMTWALWGQARKTTGTARADEGLLRLGARSMMVMFSVYVGGVLYRVRREFTLRQGNKPHLTLDVAVYDGEHKQFRSLTDKTIRQTQEAINRILGLEYDTYVNSAYLRQGNANEFSQKPPKDRKKILSTILGIDRYDALQMRALERSRTYAAQLELQKELITRDGMQLERYEAICAEEQHLVQERQRAVQTLATEEKELARLHEQHSKLQGLFAAYEQKQAQYEAQQHTLTQEVAAWYESVQRYRGMGHQLQSLGSGEELAARLARLRTQEQVWRNKQKQRLALQAKRMELEQALFNREHMLRRQGEQDVQALQQACHMATFALDQARALERQLHLQKEQLIAEMAAVRVQLQEVQVQRAVLLSERDAYAGARVEFDRRRLFYNTYVPQLRLLQARVEELSHKMGMVQGETASCPLCEQLLTAKRRSFLQERFEKEALGALHKSARLQRVLEKVKEVLVAGHAHLKGMEVVEAALASCYSKQELAAARLSQAEVRVSALDEAIAKSVGDTAALLARQQAAVVALEQAGKQAEVVRMSDQVLKDLQGQYAAIGRDLVACAYDDKEHEAVERAIGDAEQQKAALEAATARRGEQAKMRAHLQAQYRQLKSQKQLLQRQREALAAQQPDAQARDHVYEALQATQARVQAVREALQGIAEQSGRVQEQRVRLEQLRVELKQREAECAALESRYHDCVTLAQAWGKNGIQALLIEQAIPEIESAANDLLTRLTNGQAQVFIESLRDLKRGGARETLDIKIADNLGVRPYEMFSGGEAFRIDFALRIAISKLLARRAGAALQVLIIDEGFGSQDEEGLQRLMEALYMVQEDFAKIIIVTHLPSFKEHFPVHLIVEKGVGGSTVSVEQRG